MERVYDFNEYEDFDELEDDFDDSASEQLTTTTTIYKNGKAVKVIKTVGGTEDEHAAIHDAYDDTSSADYWDGFMDCWLFNKWFGWF